MTAESGALMYRPIKSRFKSSFPQRKSRIGLVLCIKMCNYQYILPMCKDLNEAESNR